MKRKIACSLLHLRSRCSTHVPGARAGGCLCARCRQKLVRIFSKCRRAIPRPPVPPGCGGWAPPLVASRKSLLDEPWAVEWLGLCRKANLRVERGPQSALTQDTLPKLRVEGSCVFAFSSTARQRCCLSWSMQRRLKASWKDMRAQGVSTLFSWCFGAPALKGGEGQGAGRMVAVSQPCV